MGCGASAEASAQKKYENAAACENCRQHPCSCNSSLPKASEAECGSLLEAAEAEVKGSTACSSCGQQPCACKGSKAEDGLDAACGPRHEDVAAGEKSSPTNSTKCMEGDGDGTCQEQSACEPGSQLGEVLSNQGDDEAFLDAQVGLQAGHEVNVLTLDLDLAAQAEDRSPQTPRPSSDSGVSI